MRARRLRVEYLAEPLGLDITRPRFSWICEGGVTQSAYRVVATRRGEPIWDSGKVASGRMTHIEYDGAPLRSRDRVEWTVTLWNEHGGEGKPQTSWFEMGLLSKEDWVARWITGGYRPKRHRRYPVDCFRREFDVHRPVARARLYITACGLYEAKLNGHRVGDVALAPGSTDYRHRLHYQAYDLSDRLAKHNALEIQLADGWYRGSIGAYGLTNVFGRRTKLLCQLEITDEDGHVETIGSDGTFAWSDDGPVRFADLKDGEVYDARRVPSYRGRARPVTERLVPTASNSVSTREKEVLSPRLLTTPSGRQVLDFGQNLAGFLAFTIRGEKGQRVLLRLGEHLDDDGEFTQSNFQLRRPADKEIGRRTAFLLMTSKTEKIRGPLQPTPKQEIVFTCSGGADSYRTTFAVFGFRYALVETDAPIDPAGFTATAVYSDMGEASTFSSSNADVDRLVANTRWSMKGNFLGVPTDCPTRERLGWTGDAQVFFTTATYLMDVAAFFRKWLSDLRDSQRKSGKPAAVAPYSGLSMLYDSIGGSVGWGDATVLIPYRHWERYGDLRVLQEFYGMMRAYGMFMIRNTGHRSRRAARRNPFHAYVYEKGRHLGEWLEPVEFRDAVGAGVKADHSEVATAYLHYTMTHLTEIANVLGRSADAAVFAEYAEGAKRAYTHMFLSAGAIDTDRQARLVRPLALGLLDGETKAKVQQRLVEAVENREYRIGTGFLSTPFVLPALTEAGRPDIAYRVLENAEPPSWLTAVKAGATTVWEDWHGEGSHNHYALGAVCQWLFDTVAGIRVDGENRFVIAPLPGGSLTHAEARHTSIYGTVASRWATTGDGTLFEVTIPVNTTAEVRLPDGSRHAAGPGTHRYRTSADEEAARP